MKEMTWADALRADYDFDGWETGEWKDNEEETEDEQ